MHLAEDLVRRRRVALKIARSRGQDARERFAFEARIGSQLAPVRGIVGVLAQERTGDGRPVLVLPYYDRGSAEDLLAEESRLALPDVLRLVAQIAQGLDAMHGQQYLHRDVSPRNVLRSTELGAGLGDLGCARPVNSVEQPAWTQALTPGYCAPEAAIDTDVQSVASDVYGLAATTWALLCGEPPYGAPPLPESSDLTNRYELRRNQAAPDPERLIGTGIPREVAQVLRTALDPDPSARPARARELSGALTAALTGREGRSHATGTPAAAGDGADDPGVAVGPLRPDVPAGVGIQVTRLAGTRGDARPPAPRRLASVLSFLRRRPGIAVVVACFLLAYGAVRSVSGPHDDGRRDGLPGTSDRAGPSPEPGRPTSPAPDDLRVTEADGHRAVLSWTPPTDPDAVTMLYRSVDSAPWEPVGPRPDGRAVVASDGSSHRYCFRLQVVVGAGPGSTGPAVCTG